MDWADVILLADLDNLERFKRLFPSALHKVTMLGLFLTPPQEEIEDPYALDLSGARVSAEMVVRAVDGLVLTLERAHAS